MPFQIGSENKMHLIGLGHKARQGKDSIARAMVKEFGKHNMYARVYGFAEGVRIACRINFAMEEKDPPLLQLVGTDLYRHFVSEDYWVNLLHYRIKEDQPDAAIITDVRFWNEAAYINKWGGQLVRVNRYFDNMGVKQIYRSTDRPNDHISETSLEDYPWDYLIENDGDLDHLELASIDMLRSLHIF